MKRSFAFIFWGLIFVVVNFTINGIDLLPNGVGYVLIAAGAFSLVSLSDQFKTACSISCVLAFLWLLSFFFHRPEAQALSLVTSVTHCFMIWKLLGGIMEYCTAVERLDFAEKADRRRRVYIGLHLAAVVLSFLLEGSRDLGGVVAVLIVGATLINLTMILHLIYRVRDELATGGVSRGI